MSHEFMVRLNNLEDRLVVPGLLVVVCLLADGFRPYVFVGATVLLVGHMLVERVVPLRVKLAEQERTIEGLYEQIRSLRALNTELSGSNYALRKNNFELSHYRCDQIIDEIQVVYQFEIQKKRHNRLIKMLENFTFCLDTLSVSRDSCRRIWHELVSKYRDCVLYLQHLPLEMPVFRTLTADIPAKYREMFKLEPKLDCHGNIQYFMPGDGLKPPLLCMWSHRDLSQPDYSVFGRK